MDKFGSIGYLPFEFTEPMRFLLLLPLFLIAACSRPVVAPPAAILPVPTERQLAWHQLEQYAFIHFTTNTFTDKEWGFGDESPEIFNPTELDANQWARVVKEAGLKGIILTTKHHDGFCLWPSQYTEHSVKASPFRDGKGDLVREVSDACRRYGLKFGVYLSPWDRNHPNYGGPEYITYYRNQLRELFTNYGPVFEMWFDGANGGDGYYGGANEKRKIDGATYYDWPGTLAMVREMAPDVIFFSDAGPDIRWVGNDRGVAGPTNWNMIDNDTMFAGKANITDILHSGAETGKNWVPAEVDVSIRPGWFYHATEDSLVKTPEKLIEIYLTSVGRGSNLLLNLPPDRRGLIHENDVAALKGWKAMLDKSLGNNLAARAEATADAFRGKSEAFSPANLTDGNTDTYWATDDAVIKASAEIRLARMDTVRYVAVQEHIQLGQRVRAFAIDLWVDGEWKEAVKGTTIGYKRIAAVSPTITDRVRIRILDARACPVISEVAVY